jgi:methylated-DNA-protein-cysteine methyltransferase-like protein
VESFPTHVYESVRRIPRGKVSTYGDIAALSGDARLARQVGWALRALPPGTRVPWWRVINSAGRISLDGFPGQEQAERLRREGIPVSEEGALSLAQFRWRPRAANARAAKEPSPNVSTQEKPSRRAPPRKRRAT